MLSLHLLKREASLLLAHLRLHEQTDRWALMECWELFAFQAAESSSLCNLPAEMIPGKLPGLLISADSLTLISLLCCLLPPPTQMLMGVGSILTKVQRLEGVCVFEKAFAGFFKLEWSLFSFCLFLQRACRGWWRNRLGLVCSALISETLRLARAPTICEKDTGSPGSSSLVFSMFCWIWKLRDFCEIVVFQEEPVEPGSYLRAPLVDEGVPPLNKDQQRQDGLGCWPVHWGQATISGYAGCQGRMMDGFSCFSLQPPDDPPCSAAVPPASQAKKHIFSNLTTKSLNLMYLCTILHA